MTRFLRIALALVTLAAAGFLLWRTVYHADPLPERAALSGLDAPVTLTWHPGDAVSVEAETDADVWRAVGYAHGLKRSWPVTLWRKTGLGHLATWFGPDVLPLDRHARRLGLARHAQEAYATLPPAEQARLQAYVDGLNAALRTSRARQSDASVLLDRWVDATPTPWEPWHPLVVERLFAWLATERLAVPDSAASPVQDFVHTDARFRQWLHLHGFSRSLLWSGAPGASDTTQVPWAARFVTGASALPVVQEVRVTRPERPALSLVTVPGSPLVWAGVGAQEAWGWLPHSPARLVRLPDTTWTRWHERLRTHRGRESLVEVYRFDDRLPFAPTADTTWALHWPGLAPVTDVPRWKRLTPPPDSVGFRLFSGYGLSVDATGRRRVYGTPPFDLSLTGGGRMVGVSDWLPQQAAALQALPRSTLRTPSAWVRHDSSTWAGAQLQRRLPALVPFADTSVAEGLRNAHTYLRNWNLRFHASSIGATVFEQWMHEAAPFALPDSIIRPDSVLRADSTVRVDSVAQARVDSLASIQRRLRTTFQTAVRSLQQTYGPQLRQWRWERMLPGDCFFPVWSADSLVAHDLSDIATTHFAPVPCRRMGHPSVPSGGTSRLAPTWPAPSPAAWTGWTDGTRTRLMAQRARFSPSQFLARSLAAPDEPDRLSLSDAPVEHVTRLHPAP